MKIVNFLYLGNLIPEKGVLVLLEACRILAKEHKTFRCHIVGAGTKALCVEECRTLVENLNLVDVVEVHGPLYGDEKEKMWERCDVFVFPTFYHNECFPLVILEAMQHALLVIATPVGAIPDMVIDEKTGHLVPIQDVKALSDTMLLIMNNTSLLRRMGERGHERYLDNYTTKHFEENLTDILRSCYA